MNQEKIGNFLKELRLEKGLTQAELGDKFYTTSRSVSRWETGKSLPDLTILIELAEFYEVGIDELIDGERCDNKETLNHQDTLKKVAEYSKTDKEQAKRKIVKYFSWISLLVILSLVFFAPQNMTGIISDILPPTVNLIIVILINIMVITIYISFIKSLFTILKDEDNTTIPAFLKATTIAGYLLIACWTLLILPTLLFDFVLPKAFCFALLIFELAFILFTLTVCTIKVYKAYKQGKIGFWDLF